MTLEILAFSEQGMALGEKVLDLYPHARLSRCPSGGLSAWTGAHFKEGGALLYIGSCGIAVRAVAPYVESKAKDPAVLVMDETGRHLIALLSGHLGGANALCLELARTLGADPVITTATDMRGLFAVDSWAKKAGLQVLNPHAILRVSSTVLSGEKVPFCTPFEIEGKIPEELYLSEPEEAFFSVDARRPLDEETLFLVPRILSLGIGCRRGTEKALLLEEINLFLEEHRIPREALRSAASIELKADEEGLLAACKALELPVRFYSAEALSSVPEGGFHESDFVKKVTGVGNVCARSAILDSDGRLLFEKRGHGVTLALAAAPYALRF